MKYDTLILDPLKEMMVQVMSFIPTLLIALGILIIGWVVARFTRTFFLNILNTIGFDKVSTKMGLSRILRIGGIKQKPSELFSCIVYSVLMVMVLIMTVKSLGLTMVSVLLDKVLAYIPHVISGAIVLIIGMLLAKAVSSLVYITARNTDMPIPEALSQLTKYAIVTYVTIIYLREIGFVSLFVGTHYTIFIMGLVFATSLAFGLAGKDVATKYLEVLKKDK